MKIQVPHSQYAGETEDREILVGGGAKFRVEGTRYLTEGTIVAINEEYQCCTIKTLSGATVLVPRSEIREVTTPEQRQFQQIVDQNTSRTNEEFPKGDLKT